MARLVGAALVNKTFCQLLLSNPVEALEQGFQSERFDLTEQEKIMVFSINATSLQDFSQQLIDYVPENDDHIHNMVMMAPSYATENSNR